MESLASRFGSKRVHQQPAGCGISGSDVLHNIFKVTLRLFFSPLRPAWRQSLQVKSSVAFGMAAVAARVPRTLFQENGLDVDFIRNETGSAHVHVRIVAHSCDGIGSSNPRCDHLPFGVTR